MLVASAGSLTHLMDATSLGIDGDQNPDDLIPCAIVVPDGRSHARHCDCTSRSCPQSAASKKM